jgi:UDP-3-O-acyl-N-acetylglucosamine deacetylase
MESPERTTLMGLGLHGGGASRLTFSMRADGGEAGKGAEAAELGESGPRFRFADSGFFPPRELARLARHADRSTRLDGGGVSIRTPEHMLAALLFFADLPVDVECDGPEPPILDGSALPFREALSLLAPGREEGPAWKEYPCGLEWEHDWGRGHIRVRPSDRFRVRFEWDGPPFRQSFMLEDAATAWREVLPARTFAMHREWREAESRGLMAGARADSGLLLAESREEHVELLRLHPEWPGGPYPLLNRPGWRMDAELAKHKILDVLGDLALGNLALPSLELDIRNGGHWINHMLLDRLSGAV